MSAAEPINEKRKFKNLARSQKMRMVVFRMERDAVLRSLSVEGMLKLLVKWNQPVPKNWGDPLAPLAIMHAARVQLPSFSYEEKIASARWLANNKFPLPPPWVYRDGKLYGPKS